MKSSLLLAPHQDPMGQAIRDFWQGQADDAIVVTSDRADDDEIPVAYLFRTWDEMPPLEQEALRACRGRVLDVGAAAGSHALWWQAQGGAVTALDYSPLAVEVMQQRGVHDARAMRFEDLHDETYDTVLMLMNGAGLAGTLGRLPAFLQHAATLLQPGGQILLDSADILYLYEEEDGSYYLDLNDRYYGEMRYQMQYKDARSKPFSWLFVSYDLLEDAAHAAGLHCECLAEGDTDNYLARLTN
ncbi:Methyltransferase domain-containing protein [Catalinimonas alkaloidigena]|uniref:Methyltransferase domain-containing protein n=1 Tax=Catalinimonas alkaloidigena TaxID=1075417 RepID=A0A1G9DR36_9BACT|nr:class I SAM-dependent methyltransferase [Catalinimonas alkaloidigena]SDK66347.1 Methyltransferase domain-containing protein [Catalinimonas alkaloidigena]